MKDTKALVKKIITKNPDTLRNSRYLWLEVLEAQGVKFYPYQREKILSNDVPSPESVSRAKRKTLEDLRKKDLDYKESIKQHKQLFTRT